MSWVDVSFIDVDLLPFKQPAIEIVMAISWWWRGSQLSTSSGGCARGEDGLTGFNGHVVPGDLAVMPEVFNLLRERIILVHRLEPSWQVQWWRHRQAYHRRPARQAYRRLRALRVCHRRQARGLALRRRRVYRRPVCRAAGLSPAAGVAGFSIVLSSAGLGASSANEGSAGIAVAQARTID